ncbi:MAG: hypothetical protein FWE06_02120 [Oscillospiraceae bacterium]|nr:hypothetical protein [Oscillospiraceae bacterium]
MKNLRKALVLTLAVVFCMAMIVMPAAADENGDYVVLFDLMDWSADDWELYQATDDDTATAGGGRIEVTNEGGVYTFSNVGNSGWPNATLAFGDDAAEAMNWPIENWEDIIVHFDIEVMNNTAIQIFDWDTDSANAIRVVGAFVDLDDDFGNFEDYLTHVGDLLAHHYIGTRTMRQFLDSRFSVTADPDGGEDDFLFHWLEFPEDTFMFAGIQFWPVGGDVIVRDFRITVPTAVYEDWGDLTPPVNNTPEPTDETGTPTEDVEPTPVETPEPSPEPGDDNDSDGIDTWIIIVIAAGVLVVGVVVFLLLSKKKGGDKK